jgi:signal transduction histidine kinase
MFVWLRDNALHLKSLLDNYLDFSRIEERRLILASERLELAGLVASVQQRFEAEAHRRGIAVEYRNREPVHVKGDRLALERVMSNLLQNALKFTPVGGRITLEVVRRGGEAVVNIADSGPGIEPDQRDALFEKFTRGEWASRQPGVGLGLFIVKELVTAHGGRVQVDSVVGQGSCFSIVLPIENGAPQS